MTNTTDLLLLGTFVTTFAGAVALVIKALGDNKRATIAAITAQAIELAKLRNDTQKIGVTTAVIEGHVNSAATRNAAILAAQDTQLAMLREQIMKLEATAMLLAQAKAVAVLDTVTGKGMAEHDGWERDERKVTADAIAENTQITRENRQLTREILATVTPKDPPP